jgi:hypothetical protein
MEIQLSKETEEGIRTLANQGALADDAFQELVTLSFAISTRQEGATEQLLKGMVTCGLARCLSSRSVGGLALAP